MIAFAPYTFLIVSLLVIPLLVAWGCKVADRHIKRKRHWKKSYGWLISILLVLTIWAMVIYGSTIGFDKLEVCHYTFRSPALPSAFDGYRIVHFSDAHVGSYSGDRQWIREKAVDSINAQHADLIVFTGDLQNIRAQELDEHMQVLSRLKAKDGVVSVLGNHDYSMYIKGTEEEKEANDQAVICKERAMGWTLLLNQHHVIEREGQRIVIAGMENDGNGTRFPQLGDISKTLAGISHDFVVMLEHDPSSWRRKIVPDGRAQLTLSGHTHGMQMAIGRWTPLQLTGRECMGWYHEGRQSLYVTKGLGGVIPFRLGATGEIAVITLALSPSDRTE